MKKKKELKTKERKEEKEKWKKKILFDAANVRINILRTQAQDT